MKNEGWIKLYRSIQDHWVYQNDKYFKWWIIVLLNVNHDPCKFLVDSRLHICNPGQSFLSIERWGELFKCSKKTVLRFFSLLESDDMIKRETIGKSNRRKHLLTVQNWRKFQPKAPKTTPKTHPKLPPNKKDKNDKNKEYIVEIINYLNEKTGKSFRSTTKSTREKINARLNEGFSVEDFKKVIDTKSNQWKYDPKMEKFLRPETLFSPKFESYLNETGKTGQGTKLVS